MDKVVLCEGAHDARFLHQIHNSIDDGGECDIFLLEESERAQTKRLTHHQVGDTFQVLIKGEGGIGDLLKLFPEIGVQMSEYDVEIYLLVDLDGKSFSDFMEDDLEPKIHEEYGNDVGCQTNELSFNDDMVIATCSLTFDNRDDEQFEIMAFYQSFEAVTGINNSDDASGQIRKINRYMEYSSEVIEDIKETIYR